MKTTNAVTIVGIDPGYAIVGWGQIQLERSTIRYQDCGAIITQPDISFSQRLSMIYTELTSLLTTIRPDIIAIEQLFFSVNAKTAMAVAQARGVILLTANQLAIPIVEYGPLQVKQSITGDGRADKHQVQAMVKKILHLSTVPKPDDVADAVAIALTHAYNSRVETFSQSL
jgi:crossover junction endodeoxyribonuclease RuvC